MKALVTGASGQLGRELCGTVPHGWTVIGLDRAALDIADAAAVDKQVAQARPDVIINAAAYTRVDQAEADPESARRANAAGPAHLARAAQACGARLLHVSTDYVFDGTSAGPYAVDARPNPVSVYGHTKLAGEQAVLAAGTRAAVVRTSWVYAAHGSNFVRTMLKLMGTREELRVVADQVGSPTWARTLATTLWAVALRPDATGLYHWSDSGVASWYDFAVAIAEEGLAAGLLSRVPRILPIATADYPTAARRPANSQLDKSRTWALLGSPGVHWRACLRAMLQELRPT